MERPDFAVSRGRLKNIVAIYPGSFDPVTNGHLDLIHRGSKLFDRLIVAIARNLDKNESLFSMEERKEMLVAMTEDLDNVAIDTFEGLLMSYCVRRAPTPCCAAYAPSATTNSNCRWR